MLSPAGCSAKMAASNFEVQVMKMLIIVHCFNQAKRAAVLATVVNEQLRVLMLPMPLVKTDAIPKLKGMDIIMERTDVWYCVNHLMKSIETVSNERSANDSISAAING